MNRLILLLLLFASAPAPAQEVFSEEALLAVIRKYHPVAKSAALGVRIAKAEVLASRGSFDPVFRTGNGRKEFDGITYYDDSQTELKIPTWYGVDFYAGTETMRGQRLNPEETKGTISYIGASVPLVQNLVMDKRRAALQQAKLFVSQSEAGQASVINNLVRDALLAYWEWWEEYHLQKMVDSSLQNARNRFVLVKKAWQLGDRPAIDTVEALTQVQTFEVARADVFTRLAKAALELSTFLWREGAEPYNLPPAAVPQSDSKAEALLLEALVARAADHPDLRQYTFKLAALQVERRLKFQSLLPDVDLKYNQLAKGRDLLQTTKGAFFQNNYRFGISLSVPLRLSQGRGEFQKAKLKLEQTTLDQATKQVQIQAKVRQYFTEWQQTTNQLVTQASAVASYAALQRGEEIRFANGESSLFFINAREQKTVEARQKLVELQAKNRRALANAKWAAGLLSE